MSYDNYRPSKFQLLPEVVKNLLIINGIMFLAFVVLKSSFGIDLGRTLGLYYIGSENFSPWQFVTHLFMHGGFWHIFSNMFALWMFGNVLENYWGGKRFLAYYLITGLGAAVIHSAVLYYDISTLQDAVAQFKAAPTLDGFAQLFKNNPIMDNDVIHEFNRITSQWHFFPGSPEAIKEAKGFADAMVIIKMNIPTVGASGAVFGVLLAFGMLFPNTLIYLYFAIPIKAKYFVTFYGLWELYMGFQNNPGDNVAHFAHLGGMLFGFIMIRFWNKRNRNYFY